VRFSTENEALDYLIGKEVKNANNPKIRYVAENREDSKYNYNEWILRKRFMFSPIEFKKLSEKQGILSRAFGKLVGSISNQDVRNYHVNTFVDWVEGKSRRRAIIIVAADWKTEANAIAKTVDLIGGDQTFAGLGLSSTGKTPATHYGCNWNCSASEYEYFEGIDLPWWKLFDGEKISFEEVLKSLGLKQIQPIT